MTSLDTTLLSRIRRLSLNGLLLGAILSCLPVLASLLTGSFTLHVRSETVSLFVVIAAYLVGCSVGGGVTALLFPLLRWRVGSAFVGIIACAPAMVAFEFSLAMSGEPRPFDWINVAIAATALGAICGPAYRGIFWDDLPNDWKEAPSGHEGESF